MSKLLFSMQWQWIHTAELQKWPETSSLLVIISVWKMDKIFVLEKSEIKWNKVSRLPRILVYNQICKDNRSSLK